MSHETIIRAWTDEEFRRGLSDAERAMLPAHPAGLIELSDTELDFAVGAQRCVTANNSCTIVTEGCCSIDTTSRLQGCPTC